jgi:hypothetical protein
MNRNLESALAVAIAFAAAIAAIAAILSTNAYAADITHRGQIPVNSSEF